MKNKIYLIVAILFSFLLSACGSGGSSNNDSSETETLVFQDLNGEWCLTERFLNVSGSSPCDFPDKIEQSEVSVMQTDSSALLQLSGNSSVGGVVNGDNITIEGMIDDTTFGQREVEASVLKIDTEYRGARGTVDWKYTQDGNECSGQSYITAMRRNGDDPIILEDWSYIQSRTFENIALPASRALLGISQAGRGASACDIDDVRLFEPNSTAKISASELKTNFNIDHYLSLVWDATSGLFNQEPIEYESYYFFNLEGNAANLKDGDYKFEVDVKAGSSDQTTVKYVNAPAPLVTGAQIISTWLPNGDLQVDWPQTSGVDQYRLGMFSESTEYVFMIVREGDTDSVVIPKSAVDWLVERNTVIESQGFTLTFQTRIYRDGFNVSRAHSSSQTIMLP